MISFPFLAVSFIMHVVAAVFVICCVALILIILVQKGRGGGLSAAFGGGMASGILGSKTGDFLTWVTIVLVSVFLLLAVVMAKFYVPAPDTEFDISPQAQQEPSASPEQPSPVGDLNDAVGDANSRTDTNAPGS
ncbi:MAG: preprotein translocase subunit SecG [Planctomycetes bacterium RBG_16_55_9]|nr:MAG: preprotein translocase subunit SecG [Planctomycetes bacterium RBG_16_55_9]